MAAQPPHPIRLVVTDDLERTRVTVFFRLFMAIPHYIWSLLFGIAAVVVAFINWWATLFKGESPKGLHNFLAGYQRYTTHIGAYTSLAAQPWPKFYMGDNLPQYPIDLEIDPPAPQRRAVTFFRLFLAIPAFFISSTLGGFSGGISGGFQRRGPWYLNFYRGGGAVGGIASVLSWFSSLVRGRSPRGLRDVIAWGSGYSAQLGGYLFLLTDRYPTSDPREHLARGPAPPPVKTADDRLQALNELRAQEPTLTLEEAMARLDAAHEPEPAAEPVAEEPLPPMPAQGVVGGDLRRSRLTVFFRLPLYVPHYVWSAAWGVLAAVVGILNWFATLALGRSPRPFARFLSAYVRYYVHQQAFLFLVGNPFPGFVGKPGSYPIDLELDPFQRQRRLTVFFRLILAVPALLLTIGATFLLYVIAILGWFSSLIRGRMPIGLRNSGGWALSYVGQFYAYVYLLSDRYPFSSPLAVKWVA
jgi:hypothetical protein